MEAADILEELAELRIEVDTDERGLRLLGPRGSLPDELAEEIRRHRDELLELVELRGWPEESRDYVRRFRRPEARLYPFLGGRVHTPLGPARLLQVCSERVCVVPDNDPSRTVFLLPSEVVPPGIGAEPTIRETEPN